MKKHKEDLLNASQNKKSKNRANVKTTNRWDNTAEHVEIRVRVVAHKAHKLCMSKRGNPRTEDSNQQEDKINIERGSYQIEYHNPIVTYAGLISFIKITL